MELTNNHINYIEFQAKDLEKVKQFYQAAFAWVFTDYGPNYTSFSASGITGGFEYADSEIINGALIVLYHDKLGLIRGKIVSSGGKICKDIFTFPGGRRFHFKDPSGNELAVWSDK